jgi:hypothetical protein
MPDENPSAFAALRALRDELRARLDQNEDYRAWKALEEVHWSRVQYRRQLTWLTLR